MNSKLKPFDPVAAMAGAKVVTRDGQSVRVICIDAEGECPVIVMDGERLIRHYTSGVYPLPHWSLFMAPITVSKWINIYNEHTVGYIYDSKEEADRRMCASRIACVKVEYEV